MKEIEFVISPEGEIIIEASGYTGGSCLKVLDEYLAHMKAHGVDTEMKDHKKKPAFYQTAQGSSLQVGSK